MNHVYENINEVRSHLITWGNPFDCDGDDVIVCITGNPGITDFYIEFGSHLHTFTGLPVCIIGHAGHERVPGHSTDEIKGKEHLFNLKGQIHHKLDLINNYIDKRSNVHLIGHSIGAWLILESVHRNDSLVNRLNSVQLLFPTLQRMAQTNNGFIINKLLRNIHFLVMLLFMFVYFIPECIRLFLVNCYLKLNSLPPHYSERILKYVDHKVGEKVLFLAYDEMDTVNALNTGALMKIQHLTNVLYSDRDGWAPVEYIDDLRALEPPLRLREMAVDHAFVLRSSKEVAEEVSDFIKKSHR